jgi:hypothetical protein
MPVCPCALPMPVPVRAAVPMVPVLRDPTHPMAFIHSRASAGRWLSQIADYDVRSASPMQKISDLCAGEKQNRG